MSHQTVSYKLSLQQFKPILSR